MQKGTGVKQKIIGKAMWKICQYKKPDDFVIATGKQYSIKEFIEIVSSQLGMKIVEERY